MAVPAAVLAVLLIVSLACAPALADVFSDAAAGDVVAVKAAIAQNPGLLKATDRQFGATLLHFAAFADKGEVVAILLDAGSDPDSRNRDGRTPLHNAAFVGADDVAKLLLAKAADPFCLDGQERSPRDWAAAKAHPSTESLLADAEAAVLIDTRAGPWKAAADGDLALVLAYIRRGANVGLAGPDGSTALHHAVSGNHLAIVDALLGAGVDVNARSKAGATALHLAAQLAEVQPVEVSDTSEVDSFCAWGLALGKDAVVYCGDFISKELLWLNRNDGTVIQRKPFVDQCQGDLAYDGQHLWALGTLSRRLYKLDPDTGEVLASYPLDIAQPGGMEYLDGELWITDIEGPDLCVVSPADGHLLRRVPVSVSRLFGLAWDGHCLWAATAWNDRLIALDRTTGRTICELRVPLSGQGLRGIRGLEFDGRRFWAVEFGAPSPRISLLEINGSVLSGVHEAARTRGAMPPVKELAGGSRALVRKLILAGADPALLDAQGRTAHRIAADREDVGALMALVDAEAQFLAATLPRPAPDFTLPDLDGNKVSLASFRGKTVALFLWGQSYIDPNKLYGSLDVAETLAQSPAAKKGDLVVLVCTRASRDEAARLSREHGFTFKVLLDHTSAVRVNYRAIGCGVMLIDPAGRLVWQRRLANQYTVALALRRLVSAPSAPRDAAALPTAAVAGGSICDFEQGLRGWTLRGDCWGGQPSADASYPGRMKGYTGRAFLCTMGDRAPAATGLAVSRPFTITSPYIHFLVGGTDATDHACVALVVDGVAARSATGADSDEMLPACWDVRDLVGRQAHLEVIDAGDGDTDLSSGHPEGRDYLLLDDLRFSESAAVPADFARGFNPDDQVMARQVERLAPDYYQQLRAGRVHAEYVPDRRVHVRSEYKVSWPQDARHLKLTRACPPTFAGQTVHAASFSLRLNGREIPGRRIRSIHPLVPESFLCEADVPPGTPHEGTAIFEADMTMNRLALLPGQGPRVQDLSPEVRRKLTEPLHSSLGERYRNWLQQEGLVRWPNEADMAFVYRALCWNQRDCRYTWDVFWGGHPSTEAAHFGFVQGRAGDCQMLAQTLIHALRANGIPSTAMWGIGHVWALIFVRDVGWVRVDDPGAGPGWNHGPLSPADGPIGRSGPPIMDVLDGEDPHGWNTIEGEVPSQIGVPLVAITDLK
ncbi:MAG: ankyrin repeat domain-containing protein [Armatimonadia bacterium]